jgi:hypothetical protein
MLTKHVSGDPEIMHVGPWMYLLIGIHVRTLFEIFDIPNFKWQVVVSKTTPSKPFAYELYFVL